MPIASKRHRHRQQLKHDFSNSELGSLYDELTDEVQGRSKASKYYQLLQALLFALCLAILAYVSGALSMDGSTLSIRGSRVSQKDALIRINETKSSTFGTAINPQMPSISGATVDLSQPIIHAAKQFDNRKRLLALGGSATFGAKLENRESTYPMVLSRLLGVHWEAVNVAVQATDSLYASQCVESMVRDAALSVDDMVKDFDVILLEYSLNGLDGFHLLARRLRRRYPSAVILYVHLWSLRMTIENAETGIKPRSIFVEEGYTVEAEHRVSLLIKDPNASWKYSADMMAESKQHSRAAYDAVQKVQGLLYELPIPETPQGAINAGLFGSDYHYLSISGHQFVAQEIYKLINLPDDKFPLVEIDSVKNDHTWGQGDQCYSWFETGQSPLTHFIGGTMSMFAKPSKWALQVGEGFGHPATISFENPKEIPQPVRLEIMSWSPNTYPKVKIQLNAENQNLDDNALLIDPLHPIQWQRLFHIPRSVHIGWVEPGKNSVTIDSMEAKEHPLRVTGIILCGACVEMDNVYTKIEAKTSDGPDPNVVPDQTQITVNAMADVRVEGNNNGTPKQTSVAGHMPPEGDFPSKSKPTEVFGRGNVPIEGQNPAIEQLQRVQSQNRPVEQRNAGNSQESAEQPNQGIEQPNGQVVSKIST